MSAWILTKGGNRYDLDNAHPGQVVLSDVAAHLASVNRFTGAVGSYSVAQHSILVGRLAYAIARGERGYTLETANAVALLAHLHDASEFALGDVSSPLKSLIGPLYLPLERAHQSAILDALYPVQWSDLRVSAWATDIVHQADQTMGQVERTALLPDHPDWPAAGLHVMTGLVMDGARRAPADVASDFVRTYHGLLGAVLGKAVN